MVQEAKHPITGAPIRILRTGAQIWKDGKTLVWVKDKDQVNSYRSDTIVTDLQIAKSSESTFLALLDPTAEGLFEFLASPKANNYMIMLLPKDVLLDERYTRHSKSVKEQRNILCIEEIPTVFKHVNVEYNGTQESIVKILAQILRFSYVLGLEPQQQPEQQQPEQYIKYVDSEPKLWFITQYYEPENSKRRKEIQYCLQKNIENPLIDKVVLLNETISAATNTPSAKVKQISIGRRLHYSDVLKYIYETVPKNTIVVFANSDIYFDTSLRHLWSINIANKFLALLRYDIRMGDDNKNAKIFCDPKTSAPRPDSQDSWIVLSDSIKAAKPEAIANFEFPFGKGGCDNAVAYEMLRQKFLVVNPTQTILSYHVHESNFRTYNPKDIIEKPVYLYLDPTPIQDFEITPPKSIAAPRQGLTTAAHKLTYKGITPDPKFLTEKQKAIFIQMLYKGTYTSLQASPPLEEEIYDLECSFQHVSGLVSGYNNLYVDSTEASKALWSKERYSIMTPSIQFPKAIAVPWDITGDYLINYLVRVLQVRQKIGTGSAFWGPNNGNLDWLQLFTWSEPNLPIVNPKSGNNNGVQLYSEHNYYVSPRTGTATVYKEDIDILRLYSKFLFRGHGTDSTDSPDFPLQRVVLRSGQSKTLTDPIVDFLRSQQNIKLFVIEDDTSPQIIAEQLNACHALICWGKYPHVWLCQPGTKILELQKDSAPSLDGALLSAAAGLEHYILPVTKTIKSKQHEQVVAAVQKILQVAEGAASAPLSKQQQQQQQQYPTLKFETLFSLAAATKQQNVAAPINAN